MTTGSEGEGGGAAAAILGGALPAGGAAPAAAEAGQGGGEAGLGADPDWWGTLSSAAEGETASNLDWVKSRGTKTLDDLVKGFRDTQQAFHDKNSGMVKVPGEGASAEEVSAYNKAIGVPDDVTGYTLPEVKDADGNVIPLDDSLLGKLLPRALERGVPAAAMNGLIADYVGLQMDDMAQFDADTKKGAQAWVTAQGAEANAKLAAIDQAGRALGFDSKDIVAIRNALAASAIEKGGSAGEGVTRMLDAFTKLGQGMAEDTIITGGKGRFGVTGREAQGELDQIKARVGTDKAFGIATRTPGTPENARYRRLLDQAAAHAVEQSRGAA